MSDNEKTAKKQDFKALLQSHFTEIPKVGAVVKGKVLSVDKGEVHIDVEGMTTGVVRGRELFAESREYSGLHVGDEVEATVVELENENCEMELSFRIAGYQKAWDGMIKLMKEGVTIKGKVVSANKGGLMMQVEALAGFMPVSQLNPDHYPRVTGGDKNRILDKLREIVGQELEVKVIDVDEKEEKLIVSERAVWEDSQKAVLESYKVGDVVNGEISALTSFGAFIKFGEGLEGLVHISEFASPEALREALGLGKTYSFKISLFEPAEHRMTLSFKQVQEENKRVNQKYKLQ
jgi:ribosomal protein S1